MAKAVQLPLGARGYNNQQLFADYYLSAVLPNRTDWQAQAVPVAPVMREIQEIFAKYKPGGNEAQTEAELIRPILQALGHTYDVQVPLKTPDGTKTPDYVFYTGQEALNANKGHVLTDELPRQGGIAVGDAKQWDRSLDQTTKPKGAGSGNADPFSNKNPSFQIYFYMLHSDVEWGILTNGRLWRLYHKASAHKLDRYYEVDLPSLLEIGSPREFLYFYSFFGRRAFDPGPLGISAFLKASADYARGVGDNLKAQVYQALRHLGQGFLDYTPNSLSTDPDTLKQVYDASLILLYRLLFILYAEDRALLPIWESDSYRDNYSLMSIKRSVAHALDTGLKLLPTSAKLWPSLRELFGLINAGSPPLKVATFNGGLFDPMRHPFLEKHTVGDAHLQQAIDMLTRIGGQFIDYRDLSERHLGSIYEGLLEYHLQPIPHEAANEPAWDGEWRVALVNDRGERHASGSYYTPDFIVKYMVDRVLGPVLRNKTEGLNDEAEIAAAVLSINVLDPAMGSGHYLVEATEYISRFLVERGVRVPRELGPEEESDLGAWKRRVVQSCIYGVDLNPLAVELAKLSLWLSTVARDRPLSFLDHHLRCGNSLVGAWISQLGVTGKRDKAKRVNKEKVALPRGEAATVQLSMFDDAAFTKALGTAVDAMWSIEETAGDTVAEVKRQEQIYRELRETLNRKYGRLADVVASREFGLKVGLTQEQWPLFVEYASGQALPAMPQFHEWVEKAERLDDEYHYFHWELEFPEVFFTREGQPKGEGAGFDGVVGNPPYVRQEVLAPFKPYFSTAYQETYHGVADLYVYFYQQGFRLCCAGGRMSYIVTNKWMRAGYGEPLRGFFSAQGALEQIIDFGHAPIFEGADVFPCIVVLQKQGALSPAQSSDGGVDVLTFPKAELHRTDIGRYIAEHSYRIPASRFDKSAWVLETSEVDDLLTKIRAVGIPLREYTGIKLYYGIKTGLNEAFLIDTALKEHLIESDPKCEMVIKPFLRGQDMGRWLPEWQGLYLLAIKCSGDFTWPWSEDPETAEGLFRQTYPSLYEYMKPQESKLRARQDKGRYWWELRSCAYYEAFERPKIMYQEIQTYPQYSFDTTKVLTNNKGFIIPTDDLWILAVLNSPLMWWHNWRYLPHMIGEALTPVGVLMEKLPIAPPSGGIRAEAVAAVLRLIEITKLKLVARSNIAAWLRREFDVAVPGQSLSEFESLSLEDFLLEVRKRRPRAAGRITPNGLRDLSSGYAEQAHPLAKLKEEAAVLERRISALVNEAYGLSEEEIKLLWETAPPRMPKF